MVNFVHNLCFMLIVETAAKISNTNNQTWDILCASTTYLLYFGQVIPQFAHNMVETNFGWSIVCITYGLCLLLRL